jgi:hypothetical protein
MTNVWRRAAVAALAAGAAIAAQFAAVSPARAAGPAITIVATAKLPPVTGDVLVFYHSGAYATAKIHGKITGATAGEVATLYAQQFPYKKPAVPLGSTTLKAATAVYSFTVTPTLATRYAVRLFAGGTSRAAVATSPTRDVYVTEGGTTTGYSTCARPVCHERLRLWTTVPPSALSVEMGKHLYPYFGLNLAPVTEPPLPTWLYLNGGHAAVTKAQRVNAGEFETTVSFSFTIGNNAYRWNWIACAKDTLSKDGLGLPGNHGCGASRVPGTRYVYLG